jgi:hypothetical protein
VSAVLQPRDRNRSYAEREPVNEDRSVQAFWHWFALGVLVFCWLAEATMCAVRGF